MREPSPRASRLALTAGVLAVATVGGGGFLLGQRSSQDRSATISPVLTATAPAPTPSSTASAARVLRRADLLALAAEAADATASGSQVPASIRDAVGKPFAIALPFGCDGPTDVDSAASMGWYYDASAGALRLNVRPVTWSPDEWSSAGAALQAEAIEGFWISRPWTRSEACPSSGAMVAPTSAEPVTLAGQTLAIGQAFGAQSTRQGRRDGKPYTSVLRMARTDFDASRGLALRLTGRISAGPNGSAITCRQSGGADQRPVCLVLVALEDVTIADPVSETILASWPMGSPRAGGGAG